MNYQQAMRLSRITNITELFRAVDMKMNGRRVEIEEGMYRCSITVIMGASSMKFNVLISNKFSVCHPIYCFKYTVSNIQVFFFQFCQT